MKLKENHADTRQRVSVMTCVTSSPVAASQSKCLPIELLFKAKSKRRTRSLSGPPDVNVSVAWAEKGSYKTANFLAYLERWLDPWTPQRAAAKDYRVLMVDVATSHCDPSVQELAWSRGYVMLYHLGCTTAVAQVNDTDLHMEFSRLFLEFEQAAFLEAQLYDPGFVGRKAQDVVDDVVATWKALNHMQAVAGHKRVGLTLKLDGSEDHMLRGEAERLWKAVDMPGERRRAIAEVDEAFAARQVASSPAVSLEPSSAAAAAEPSAVPPVSSAVAAPPGPTGPLSFHDWRDFVRLVADPGVTVEGLTGGTPVMSCAARRPDPTQTSCR